MKWSYGVTTVYHRRDNLLPKTLESLKGAGFSEPRLYADGCHDPLSWEKEFNLPVTGHWPYIRSYGNWILGLWELFIREPLSDLYALFQDDLMICRNVKQYLERCKYPKNGYLNLYTTVDNQSLVPTNTDGSYQNGFWPSNQKGEGAIALVFSRQALATLLTSPQTATRLTGLRPTSNIDGCVVDCLSDSRGKNGPPGWKEYIHSPSLVQHLGDRSTMGHSNLPKAQTFLGEDFDALELLNGSLNSIFLKSIPTSSERNIRKHRLMR